MIETTQVICAWPLSEQYDPATRILYYVLVATCVLAKHQEWLRNACFAAALLLPAVASLHSIVLAAVHVDNAVDMDIYGAFQICSIAVLTAPITLNFSKIPRINNLIFVWTGLLLAGMLSLTVEFFRTQVHACSFGDSDNPISPYNAWELPYQNADCNLHCVVGDSGPYSPLRQGGASIYVIPQPTTLTFGTAALLAAGCSIPPALALIFTWENILGLNWNKRHDRNREQMSQMIDGTNGKTRGRMIAINMKVEDVGRITLMCIFGAVAIVIPVLGEINFWTKQVIYETEGFSSVGQWSNFVANALVILGPALFVRNGYTVIPDEAERNSNPQNIPESYNHYCHRGDGNSIYSGISRVSSASGSRSPSPGRLHRSSTTPVDGAEPSSLELRRFTTSQTPGRARTGRRRQNPLRLWLQGICSTPPSGYERIFYYCGCGELSYVDVKELSPGGILRFRRRLTVSSRAAMIDPRSPQTLTSPTTPAQAYLRNNTNLHHSPTRLQGPSPPLPDNDQATGIENRNSSSTNQGIPQYLLLCVNTKSSTTLVQLEIGSISNDQYLFERISQEYQKVRRDYEWHISRIIPSSVSGLLYAPYLLFPPLLNFYNSFPMLHNALSKAHIHTIASGDFVRFHLVPIGERCCPRWFKKREVPPEEEIRAKRYLYEPVPMDDVEIADIPLKHLLKPGPHTDKFWITTFPKKLNGQLVRPAGQDGQRVIGWGIRVNEDLNWPYILLLIWAALITSGVIVVIYAALTSDSSSAFSLGAFLVALLTVYVTYQYFAWKEEDNEA